MEDDRNNPPELFTRSNLQLYESTNGLGELVNMLNNDLMLDNVLPGCRGVTVDAVLDNIASMNDHDALVLLGRALVSENNPIQTKQMLLAMVYRNMTCDRIIPPSTPHRPTKGRGNDDNAAVMTDSITVTKDQKSNIISIKATPAAPSPRKTKSLCSII